MGNDGCVRSFLVSVLVVFAFGSLGALGEVGFLILLLLSPILIIFFIMGGGGGKGPDYGLNTDDV